MTSTETISPRYRGLDSWTDEAILDAFSEGQERAVAAVRRAHPAIAAAARAIAARTGEAGRLIYVGAGSSGLLAALDGSELAGTFGWPETRTVFLIASGAVLSPALLGGPEDDGGLGRAQMLALRPEASDTVIAVAASGATPYTLTATAVAKQAGALTIGIASNAHAPLLALVDHPVFLDSGAEIIQGSTRMNAGTAQKAALGLLSSLTMLRLGHVYDGLMVSVRADNAKLRRRALAMVVHIAGCDEATAIRALDLCAGQVKPASLVARGVSRDEAERRLAAANGHLRAALAGLA